MCIQVENLLDESEYSGITVENIQLNGKRLSKADIKVCATGFELQELEIK